MKNQENLEGIVSRLKQQGIEAGETEKQQIIASANEQAKKMLADAEQQSKQMIEKARAEAAQIEKNSQAAIAQASRDVIEATKIALTNHLKHVFGEQCKTLMTQEEYLQALLKAVLDTVQGNKTVEVSPEQVEKMQSFVASSALKEGIEVKPLAQSDAKISVTCEDDKGIQFVITAKDIEEGLFSLLNQDLVKRINNTKED